MASAESNLSQVELAMCRLVEATETIKFLGPGCLSRFASTPKSHELLVASNQVLTKSYLRAIENQEKEISKKRKPSVKIFAEFSGINDGTYRTLQRIPVIDLYHSIEDDVFEVNGIIYISLTSGLLRKNNLLNRSLQTFIFNEESASLILASDHLQCLMFRGESTRVERNVVFDTRVYDLLQFDSVLAGDDGRIPQYFLRSDTKKPFFKEDEFEEGEKPLGAVIVNKDCCLFGFLNFVNRNPVPLLFGIGSSKCF